MPKRVEDLRRQTKIDERQRVANAVFAGGRLQLLFERIETARNKMRRPLLSFLRIAAAVMLGYGQVFESVECRWQSKNVNEYFINALYRLFT